MEQRVLLTTLALYILAAFTALKGEVRTDLAPQTKVAIWVGFLVLAALAITYLRRIHRANRINIDIAEAAEMEILNLVGSDRFQQAVQDLDLQVRRSGKFAAWWWQVATILFTALGSAYLVTMQ